MISDTIMMLSSQIQFIEDDKAKMEYSTHILELLTASGDDLPQILSNMGLGYLLGKSFRNLHKLESGIVNRVMKESYRLSTEFGNKMKEAN